MAINTIDLVENDGIRDYVEKEEDKSDSLMERVRIEFKNGYSVSIIQGEYAYCGPDSYEIALFDGDVMDGSLFDEEDQGDDVLGYCDREKVIHYLKKLARM